MGRRKLKEEIVHLLTSASEQEICHQFLEAYSLKKVISTLFGLICVSDTDVSRKAICLMGCMVNRLFSEDQEAARVIVRRLVWNLNDESGGIGWGSPEAMGEIMVRNKTLADEFAHILVSYIREDGAYLDFGPLQQGVLRALERLAKNRSGLLNSLDTTNFLQPLLESVDADIRTLAARTLVLLEAPRANEGPVYSL